MPEEVSPMPTWVLRTYSDDTFTIPWNYPVSSFYMMLGIVSQRYLTGASPLPTPSLRRTLPKPSKTRRKRHRS